MKTSSGLKPLAIWQSRSQGLNNRNVKVVINITNARIPNIIFGMSSLSPFGNYSSMILVYSFLGFTFPSTDSTTAKPRGEWTTGRFGLKSLESLSIFSVFDRNSNGGDSSSDSFKFSRTLSQSSFLTLSFCLILDLDPDPLADFR